MKCLAITQGPKVRVNAVLPGLLLTEWVRAYSPRSDLKLTGDYREHSLDRKESKRSIKRPL